MKVCNKIPVVYSEEMNVELMNHVSPSSSKPDLVARALQEGDLPVQFTKSKALSSNEICLAHDPLFVTRIFTGQALNGFGNNSTELAESLKYTNGSMLQAAQEALNQGVAASLSSGFHHAHYARAEGFCTFNGLMITALALQNENPGFRVAIIDCDYHYGNGTDDIIRKLKVTDIFHLSFGQFYFGASHAQEYLHRFEKLQIELESFKPHLILYQAGADAHVNDPLGGVLTTEQMRERDNRMFTSAKLLGIPIAFNLAGGYQRDKSGSINAVIQLHVNTFQQAAKVFV